MCGFFVLIGGFQGSCCRCVGGFVRSFCVRHLFRCFRAAGGMSFRFSVNRGLMCGYLLLFHDSFIIFHVKNNAVQHAYYYHNTFAPHCFCGLAGREMVCAGMEVPAQIFGVFVNSMFSYAQCHFCCVFIQFCFIRGVILFPAMQLFIPIIQIYLLFFISRVSHL